MKKIVLGCAAVLLSLGLLAGCNNDAPIEEAVLINVDSSATVVVGDTLELPYTVSPEKAEVVAASDNEDIVTAVAQEGTLYLEGASEGSAIVTLVGTYKKYAEANVNINVSVVSEGTVDQGPEPQEGGDGSGDTGPGEEVIALSIDPISTPLVVNGDLVQVTYTVDPAEAEVEMVVAETGVATVEWLEPDAENQDSVETAGWYLTPVAVGETTLTVTATLEDYETASVEVAIKVHEEGYTPLTTQENYTLTVTFASAIPNYADAYICGYLDGSTWTDYTVGVDTTTKMTISEERLTASYVFETVPVGEIIYNIYFEYNSNAQYHEAATGATWAHHVFDNTSNGTFVVSDDENVHETTVTLEVNPGDLIGDSEAKCELTVAIKDTGSGGFQNGFGAYFYHWISSDQDGATFVDMTQGACGSYTAETDYYFTVSTDGVSDGAGHTYYISQGDSFEFQVSCTNETNAWSDAVTIKSDTTVPSELTAWSTGRAITLTSTGSSCDSALIVLEFDFSACSTETWSDDGPHNLLITKITYVSNWKAE